MADALSRAGARVRNGEPKVETVAWGHAEDGASLTGRPL